MGDVRFEPAYAAIAHASDRLRAIRETDDEALVAALAAASRSGDALLANVLATETHNRIRRLRAALAHMAEGVLALDLRGRIQWANPAAERLLRLRREGLVGSDVHASIEHRDAHKEIIPDGACAILAALRSGQAASREAEHFRRGDGTLLCVAYTVAPIRGPEGALSGGVLVFRDFGSRRDWEHALLEARERYESLFERVPFAVVSLGEDGVVLEVNEAAMALTGLGREEVRGHGFMEFLHEEDVGKALDLFQEILAGHRRSSTFRVRTKAGSYRLVFAEGVPIVTAGRVTGVHCLLDAKKPVIVPTPD